MKYGFTIIETLTTIAITVLALGAVSWAIISFYRANGYIIQQAIAVDNARRGIEMMIQEIREASYSDTGAYPIVSVSNTELIFYSDIDRDNNVERVRYTLNGSILERGEIEAAGDPLVYDESNEITGVLSEYVRNSAAQPLFIYFDSSGNEITDLDNVNKITLVKINLIVDVLEDRVPEEFILKSTAQMRNLKTNL